jgi:hypothetical protein
MNVLCLARYEQGGPDKLEKIFREKAALNEKSFCSLFLLKGEINCKKKNNSSNNFLAFHFRKYFHKWIPNGS